MLVTSKYSIDLNIWGRAIEGTFWKMLTLEPPKDAFQLVKFNNDKADYLDLEFEDGFPVGVDGRRMSILNLIENVNTKVGSFGVGIIDHIEDRVIGIKSREVYEARQLLQ